MLLRVMAPAALLLAACSIAFGADAPAAARSAPGGAKSAKVSKSTNAQSANVKAPPPAPAKPKPPAHDPKATRVLSLPGIGEITVYAPQGEAKGLALFASGDGGWNLGVWDMAHSATALGYWVAGFSTPAFLKTIRYFATTETANSPVLLLVHCPRRAA